MPRLLPILEGLEARGGFKDVMATREAADYVGLTGKHRHETVARWCKEDGLPHSGGDGSPYRIRKTDLDDWLTRGAATCHS